MPIQQTRTISMVECVSCPDCEKILVLSTLPPESKRPFIEGHAQGWVIVCQGFDDPAVFTPAKWPASGLYPDANGAIQGAMDTTITASGAGSLKFHK